MKAPIRGYDCGPLAEIPTEITMQTDPVLLAKLHEACTEEPWDASAMARLLGLPETVAFIAARGAEPCGLVLTRRAGEDCEILTIGVKPAMRIQGVGAGLLNTACDWGLRIGACRLVLEVAADNHPALRLYEKCGFEGCGHRPGYYPGLYAGIPKIDALILQKPLGRRRLGHGPD